MAGNLSIGRRAFTPSHPGNFVRLILPDGRAFGVAMAISPLGKRILLNGVPSEIRIERCETREQIFSTTPITAPVARCGCEEARECQARQCEAQASEGILI